MEGKRKNPCYNLLFLLAIVSVEGAWNISGEEDMELERKLKIMNKPAIKRIKVGDDIFNCVNIKEQPSLDHHLLKNHKIQMTPSFLPKSENSSNEVVLQVAKPCPAGTVPIPRLNKEDLIRAKAFSNVYKKKYGANGQPQIEGNPGYHLAIKQTNGLSTSKFFGAQAYFNVYNPPVLQDQFSGALMFLLGSPNVEMNSIHVGWMVNRMLYGDNLTRIFTYWIANGDEQSSCINLFCPGFVQVSSTIFLGNPVSPTSVYRGQQYDVKFSVYKDPSTSNWWLVYGKDSTPIGYWPGELFKSLFGVATDLRWGGEVHSLPGVASPAMGSGHIYNVGDGCGESAYVRNVQILGKLGGQFRDVESYEVGDYVDNPNCYNMGIAKDCGSDWGYAFNYGGPGGNCGN